MYAQELRDAWRDYEESNDGAMVTIQDVADALESAIDDGLESKELSDTLDEFRKGEDDDFNIYAGRGGDYHHERLGNAVQKWIKAYYAQNVGHD